MKYLMIALLCLTLFNCENNDDNNSTVSETDINLITGLNIRNSEYSEAIQLGNPNIYTNDKFISFPNPPIGHLSLSSLETISNAWILPANADKIFQETNFNSILNSSLYDASTIESNADLTFLDLNSNHLTLNLENLNPGYYKVFVEINETIYWDNIYIPHEDFEIDDLFNFWN